MRRTGAVPPVPNELEEDRPLEWPSSAIDGTSALGKCSIDAAFAGQIKADEYPQTVILQNSSKLWNSLA